jgi:hypothetical protein
MSLNDSEIALIKGMLNRGDRQSDIAAYFGCNAGRIAEINTGHRASNVKAARDKQLPPPGPYQVSVRTALKTIATLEALRDLIDQTLTEIKNWEQS